LTFDHPLGDHTCICINASTLQQQQPEEHIKARGGKI